jgi:hypothetical protein
MKLTIAISGRKIALTLGIISVYLCVQSIVAKQIEYAVGIPSYTLYHLVQLVNVSFEQSIPAW